jgi:hypothetical protein
MRGTLTLQLKLVSQSSESLTFRLTIQNSSDTKFVVPRPAISSLHFGNMATGKQSQWQSQSLISGRWNGFFLEPEEDKKIDYRVRPSSIPRKAEEDRSEYSRFCIDLPAADYLVWFKFEVNENYVCGDSHYRYADLVWDAIAAKAQVWTGLTVSNRLKIAWG